MTNIDEQELDRWKDFVLKVIVERGGATLTDYVWNRLRLEYKLDSNNRNNILFNNSVLLCLENEFQLISRSGERGISITEKGKYVAQKGYRSYIKSIHRHNVLHRVNDYVSTITVIISMLTGVISFVNLYFNWSDKLPSFGHVILFIILYVASVYFSKSNINK